VDIVEGGLWRRGVQCVEIQSIRRERRKRMTGNFSIEKKMFDSSCIADYMGCPRLFYYSWIRRLEMKEEKPSLTFGKVFHEVLLEWYRTGKQEEAEKKFDQLPSMVTMDKLTKDWGVSIFKKYVERYKTEQGKTLHLEVKFKVEIEERIYAGTMDRIEEWDGQVYVSDHKTSSSLQLSDCSHRPNPQIDGYCYACREIVGKCAGAIINGISTAQNPKERFNRFITNRTEEEMDRWKEVFTDTTDNILRDVERGHFPMSTIYCNRWGKCKFWPLCVYEEEEKMIEQNFTVAEEEEMCPKEE
jgi:hypothetical protein